MYQKNTKGLFLLTGSSDIFRSARVQEALPGHMARVGLLPLSHAERNQKTFNVIDRIMNGDFTLQSYRSLDKISLVYPHSPITPGKNFFTACCCIREITRRPSE